MFKSNYLSINPSINPIPNFIPFSLTHSFPIHPFTIGKIAVLVPLKQGAGDLTHIIQLWQDNGPKQKKLYKLDWYRSRVSMKFYEMKFDSIVFLKRQTRLLLMDRFEVNIIYILSWPTFSCSKSTLETPE